MLPPAEYPELSVPVRTELTVLPVVLVGVSLAAGLRLLVVELWLEAGIAAGIAAGIGPAIEFDIGIDIVPAPDDEPGAVEI